MEYHKKLSEKNFIERSMVFKKKTEEKIQRKALEAASRPDQECTFAPNIQATLQANSSIYNTAKKGGVADSNNISN